MYKKTVSVHEPIIELSAKAAAKHNVMIIKKHGSTKETDLKFVFVKGNKKQQFINPKLPISQIQQLQQEILINNI